MSKYLESIVVAICVLMAVSGIVMMLNTIPSTCQSGGPESQELKIQRHINDLNGEIIESQNSVIASQKTSIEILEKNLALYQNPLEKDHMNEILNTPAPVFHAANDAPMNTALTAEMMREIHQRDRRCLVMLAECEGSAEYDRRFLLQELKYLQSVVEVCANLIGNFGEGTANLLEMNAALPMKDGYGRPLAATTQIRTLGETLRAAVRALKAYPSLRPSVVSVQASKLIMPGEPT